MHIKNKTPKFSFDCFNKFESQNNKELHILHIFHIIPYCLINYIKIINNSFHYHHY